MQTPNQTPNTPDEGFVELRDGVNFWTTAQADKAAFLVDGESYYRAFREALMQAERYVCILAWDLKGEIELLRDTSKDDDLPTKLVDFLYALLDAKPNLEIHILLWDYSMVYIGEREWLTFSRFRQEPHPRLHLQTDSAISIGASQHQKVVVVDGRFAFCGGVDLSTWRWDTQDHTPEDPRRVTPDGETYQPFHDIQAVVTGDAALKLDELCRDRWKRATGKTPPWGEPIDENQVWPISVEADIENTETVFSLTYSEYKNYPAVTHIEQLHLDMIAAAKHSIYLENQYLSSHSITEALMKRLREKDGPEIVLVITRDTGGWLEEGTLGLLRAHLLENLTEADEFDRFAAYFPHVRDEDHATQVYVHSKTMICDERAIMTGSANLSNRSMKVDSEIMLSFGLTKDAHAAAALLRRLLGIHLHTDSEEVDRVLTQTGSIHATIRQLRENNLHQLRDLEISCEGPIQRRLAETQLLDPDEPIDLGYHLKKVLATEQKSEKSAPPHNWVRYAKIAVGVLIIFVAGIALKEAWGGAVDRDSFESFFQSLNRSVWTLPILFGVFFIAGFTGISLNLLLVSAVLVIGPWSAFSCGFLGSLLSAVVTFLIGVHAGQPILRRFFESQMQRLSEKIQNRGALSIALLRLVPVAPFVVINLIAGLSKLKLRTFVGGSVLGMLPGMAIVCFLTHQAKNAYTDPSWQTWSLLALGLAALLGLTFGVKRYLK